jgi:tRNA G18 (ribose-2'-O)-methylase SpoU
MQSKDMPGKEVLVLGNEVTGVDPELLDLCDQIVHIPMRGQKRSFNVEVAFAIAAYSLAKG